MRALVLLLASVVVISVSACGDKQTQAVNVTSAPAPKPVVIDPQPMTMGFKPEQFQERFNAAATAKKSEFRISNIQLKPSTEIADLWQYSFTSRVAFLAPVNKSDGTIRSINYAGAGDGSVQSGADIMFALGMLVRAIDPAIADDTANKLVLDLMGAMNEKDGVKRVRNGVSYSAGFIPGAGFIVGINPVQ